MFVIVSALVMGLAFTGSAQAARPTTPTSGVHFTQGGQPSCTLTNGSVDCTAELAGLGQGDIIVTATVQALATYTCQNRGGNQAPGQNRVPGPEVGSGEPTVIPADQIDNGRATVSDDAGPATVSDTVTGRQAGCPNGNWTGVNPVIVGYVVHFEATQGGVLLFCREGTSSTASGSVALSPCSDGGGVAR
ncbi:MAG TPA: hypothetical protein VK402_19285 [Blastococcus sp.]|nr:hypothetical protein [Blastococcus sp.]